MSTVLVRRRKLKNRKRMDKIRKDAMKSRAIEFKMIFKDQDWEIRETNGEYAFAQVATVIYHQCGATNATGDWTLSPRIWMFRKELKNPCGICNKTPPPGIQAMFQFLNYDCPGE